MSTKIYNGLRLRNATLEQALEKLRSVRESCVQAAKEYTARQAARKTALMLDMDMNFCLTPYEPKSPFWTIHDAFGEAKKKVLGTGVRDTTWDSSFDISLIPSGRDILAIYYIEHDHGYVSALESLGFEDFHYQNCTDRPDDISEFEWAARQAAWRRALPGITTPADVGLTFQMVCWDDFVEGIFDRDLMASQHPTEDSRRRAVSLRLTEMEVSLNSPGLRVSELVEHVNKKEPDRRTDIILREHLFVKPYDWEPQ